MARSEEALMPKDINEQTDDTPIEPEHCSSCGGSGCYDCGDSGMAAYQISTGRWQGAQLSNEAPTMQMRMAHWGDMG